MINWRICSLGEFVFEEISFRTRWTENRVPGGPKDRLPTRGQGGAAVGRTQDVRATKYIEFHGSVRLPYVYLQARSLYIYGERSERLVAAVGAVHGKKLLRLVQIQID
jgi:hypothetical protein